MTITQNYAEHNNLSATFNSIDMGYGNLVPHWWYQRILSCGKPDTVAIAILSEIMYLHRKSGRLEFQLDYHYFEDKFHFTRTQLKSAFIRLEEMDVLYRNFRTIPVGYKKLPHQLFLTLNTNSLSKLRPANLLGGDVTDQNFKYNFLHQECINNLGPYEEKNTLHISNNKISINILSRSTDFDKSKANFSINSSDEEQDLTSSSAANTQSDIAIRPDEDKIDESKKAANNKSVKTLADFYPLSDLDVRQLQASSGREFSLNAINEILKDIARKHPEHNFLNRQAFMSYMSKVLKHEMRDSVKTNNNSFRIRNREDNEFQKQEHYLTAVEETTDISKEAQVRRKIAAILDRITAYLLLTKAKFKENQGTTYEIYLSKSLELTDQQRNILLNQIQAVYGNHIEKLKFITATQKEDLSKAQPTDTYESFEGVWGKIRLALISHFGKGHDQAWFSKLEAKVDIENKAITLQAPNTFFRDWIENNYLHMIEKIAGEMNFKLNGIA